MSNRLAGGQGMPTIGEKNKKPCLSKAKVVLQRLVNLGKNSIKRQFG
jgi:hypothetical protein